MKPTLSQLKAWARQAGELLHAGFDKKHDIRHKGTIDLVTEMDKKAETLLINNIQSQFTNHTIITEESGHLNGHHNACWYIDPLDGTVNYAHGFPLFSVSLAYAEDGKSILGVVYDPTRNECFSAERGQGAWLNDEPIHVAQANKLIDCILTTGFPYDVHQEHTNLNHFTNFMLKTQGVRRTGSAALDLCYVAAGRFDGYWEAKLCSWDLAAGALIAEEAGGIVTNLLGETDYLKPPYSMIAANPDIHELLLAEIIKTNQA